MLPSTYKHPAPVKIELVALAVVVCVAAAVGVSFWGYSYDDSFVTYTYARNWVEGRGLTYNGGRAVFGTSAPGYALFLGMLARITTPLGLDVPGWGTLISILSLLAVGFVLYLAVAGAPVVVRGAVAFLFTVTSLLLRWNVELLGAESFPVLALVVGAAYLLYHRNRHVGAGLLMGAAMMFRLDAGLAALSVGLVWWVRNRRFPWKFAVGGLVPLAAWLVFLVGHFGFDLPSTLMGKRSEFPLALQNYTWSEWQWLRRTLPVPGCVALLGLAAVGLAAGVRSGLWKRPMPLALGLWVVAHELFYRLVRVPFAPWYQIVTLHAVLAAAVFGAVVVSIRALPERVRERSGPATAWVCAVLTAGVFLLPVLGPSVLYGIHQSGNPPDPRFRIYAQIGRFIDRTAEPDDLVATIEVGVVGYWARRPILDFVGLVSPEVIEAKEEGRLPDLVARLAPRFIVDVPLHRPVVGPILDHPETRKNYRVVARFRTEEYAGGVISLLERVTGERGPNP